MKYSWEEDDSAWFEYRALGFSIYLSGPTKWVHGVQVPDVDLNELQALVFQALEHKPGGLTIGEQIFMQSYSRVNQAKDKLLITWEKGE